MDPPLRVREDWWVFEDLLRVREDWWVFEKTLKVQGRTGRFSKKKLIILWLLRRKPLYLHRIKKNRRNYGTIE